MSILSPHRVSVRGKVVNLKFVSILGQNLRRLKLLKNKMYKFLSTLKCDHNVLFFMAFGCALREQLHRQFMGGPDAGNSRFGL